MSQRISRSRCRTDTMAEIPCRFIAHSKGPLDLVGAHAFACLAGRVSSGEPLDERQVEVVKDRIGGDSELVSRRGKIIPLAAPRLVHPVGTLPNYPTQQLQNPQPQSPPRASPAQNARYPASAPPHSDYPAGTRVLLRPTEDGGHNPPWGGRHMRGRLLHYFFRKAG